VIAQQSIAAYSSSVEAPATSRSTLMVLIGPRREPSQFRLRADHREITLAIIQGSRSRHAGQASATTPASEAWALTAAAIAVAQRAASRIRLPGPPPRSCPASTASTAVTASAGTPTSFASVSCRLPCSVAEGAAQHTPIRVSALTCLSHVPVLDSWQRAPDLNASPHGNDSARTHQSSRATRSSFWLHTATGKTQPP